MSRFLSRLSKDVTQETYKITLKIVSVTYHTPEDLYGVYIKVKRGKRRTNGQNRYAIYSSVNNVKGKQNSKGNSTVEINEMFEQISVFYRNINNHKFQTKKIVIKLKQENVAAKKDKVLGKVVFDGGLFVGKRDAKCELKFIIKYIPKILDQMSYKYFLICLKRWKRRYNYYGGECSSRIKIGHELKLTNRQIIIIVFSCFIILLSTLTSIIFFY